MTIGLEQSQSATMRTMYSAVWYKLGINPMRPILCWGSTGDDMNVAGTPAIDLLLLINCAQLRFEVSCMTSAWLPWSHYMLTSELWVN